MNQFSVPLSHMLDKLFVFQRICTVRSQSSSHPAFPSPEASIREPGTH